MLIGIDLGTTFSAVARINKDGRAEIIPNRDGERTTPSVVMFEDDTVIVVSRQRITALWIHIKYASLSRDKWGKRLFLSMFRLIRNIARKRFRL